MKISEIKRKQANESSINSRATDKGVNSKEQSVSLTESRNIMVSNIKRPSPERRCAVISIEGTVGFAYSTVAVLAAGSTTVGIAALSSEENRTLAKDKGLSSKEALNLRAKMLSSSSKNNKKEMEMTK